MSVINIFVLTFMTFLGFDSLVARDQRPNVVIIQTDDQGYDDLGFHGNRMIQTPAMDRLAREGVSFSQFYAHETCAPTRASLLTGRHFLSVGVWGVHGGRDYVNQSEVTFAEIFRAEGYRTALYGKWHSGKTSGYLPWERGFEEAWMVDLYQYVNNTMLHNGKSVATGGWYADFTTDRALEFMEKNRDEAFLLYLPYMEPHEGNGPNDSAYTWHAPERFIAPYRDKGLSPAMERLYGMISHVDYQIGRVLNKLDDLDLDQNTIVIFLSDNGPIGSNAYPSDQDWQERNPSGLRGNKGTVFENGLRIPFVVRWPQRIKPGRSDQVGSVHDVLPTLLDLSDISLPAGLRALSGVSLKPVLENPLYPLKERPLFFSTRAPDTMTGPYDSEFYLLPDQGRDRRPLDFKTSRTALRKGSYKLIHLAGSYLLFDLKSDPQEKRPIDEPYIFAQMKQELEAWWRSMVNTPEAFAMPTFRIGSHRSDWARVYANGAIDATGPVRIYSHDTRGWSRAGDSLSLRVDVRRGGLYQLKLQARPQGKNARVRLRVGNVEWSGDPTALPQLALPIGPALLRLEVLSAAEGVFDTLEALDFTLLREDQRYPACEVLGGGYGQPFVCGEGLCRKTNQEWFRNQGEDYWCRIAHAANG